MTEFHAGNMAVGADIVDVGRVRSAIEKFGGAFLEKIFTEVERRYCIDTRPDYCSLSARFAAKEAFSKALGVGIGIGSTLKWHDVAVQNLDSGTPTIVLTEKAVDAMNLLGFKTALVSLSHTKTLAQAVVLLIS
jgi:holo-[acyl-carrier protein] synthase